MRSTTTWKSLLLGLPLFATLISLLVFNISSVSSLDVVLRFWLPALAVGLSSLAMRRRKYLWAAPFAITVLIYGIYGIVLGDPMPVLVDIKDYIYWILAILLGAQFSDWRTLRSVVLVAFSVSVAMLLVEFVLVPVDFWRWVGYYDYYLARQEVITSQASGGFVGHYDSADALATIYLNYPDSFLTDQYGDKIPFNRYGGILGDPILFGQLFSSIAILLFVLAKLGDRRRLANRMNILVVTALCLGFFLIKTKAYWFCLFSFFISYWWYVYPRRRFYLYMFAITAIVGIVVYTFLLETSGLGHFIILYTGVISVIEGAIFGSGFGVVKIDDSMVARMLIEGGVVLVVSFGVSSWLLIRELSKCRNAYLAVPLAITLVSPMLLTSAGASGMPVYLIGVGVGTFLGERYRRAFANRS